MNIRYSSQGRRGRRHHFGLTAGIILLILLVGGVGAWMYLHVHVSAPPAPKTTIHKQSGTAKPAAFDKKQYSVDEPSSIWVVVNKQRPLAPKDYIPSDLVVPNVPLRVPGNESMQLREVAARALEQLFAGAKADGIALMLSSGYRSYAYQVSLYGSYVKSYGQAQADTFSARPGYSEHQTGLAADIEPFDQKCDVDACFGDLPEGKWLAANAYKYGFVIRYTEANQTYAGYVPEPWHIRYVGLALATELHQPGAPASLEQFFGLPAATHY